MQANRLALYSSRVQSVVNRKTVRYLGIPSRPHYSLAGGSSSKWRT